MRTIRRHTSGMGKGTWRLPPKQEAKVDDFVISRRLAFAKALLNTNETALRPKYNHMTFIDSKRVGAFGVNRTHKRQFRRRGSKKRMTPVQVRMNNPTIHMTAVANKKGTDMFFHGKWKKMPRKKVNTWDDTTVNSDEFLKCLKKSVVPFMKKTKSKILVSDCVGVAHTKQCRDFLKSKDIELVDKGGRRGGKEGGYPPYSHDCSILDASMFATLQNEVSEFVIDKLNGSTDKEDCFKYIHEGVTKIWKTDKYTKLAQTHLKGYHARLQKIVQLEGQTLFK